MSNDTAQPTTSAGPPPVRCRHCNKELKLGVNGPKAVTGGYTCWENPRSLTEGHRPDRAWPKGTKVERPPAGRPAGRARSGGIAGAPRRNGNQVVLRGEVEKLQAQPGEWMALDCSELKATRSAHSVVDAIRYAKLFAFRPHGDFEAKVESIDGKRRVVARYVGHLQQSQQSQQSEPEPELTAEQKELVAELLDRTQAVAA